MNNGRLLLLTMRALSRCSALTLTFVATLAFIQNAGAQSPSVPPPEEVLRSTGASNTLPVTDIPSGKYREALEKNIRNKSNTVRPAAGSRVVLKDAEAEMNIALGAGWDPFSPRANKLAGGCFEANVPSTEPVVSDRFESVFVDSFSSFREITSISIQASGEGRYGAVSFEANAGYRRAKDHFSSNKKIVWIVTGQRSYASQPAIAVRLTPRGERFKKKANGGLFSGQDPERFYRPCGRYLVTSVTKANRISVVYVFEASSLNTIDSIKASVSAAFSAPSGSGSANVDVFEEVRKVDNKVQLQVEVLQNGVFDNQSALANLVTQSPGDIGAARAQLASAISNISWERSPIDRFKAEPVSDYIDVLDEVNPTAASMYFAISQLRRRQDSFANRYFELTSLQDKESQGDVRFNDGAGAKIDSEITALQQGVKATSDEIARCLDSLGDTCDASAGANTAVSDGILRFLDIKVVAFDRWEVSAGGGYDAHRERIVANANYWPVFYLPAPEYVRRLTLYKTDNVSADVPQYTVAIRAEQGDINENVRGTTLVMRPLWSTGSYRQEWYCWRGRWGEDCAPWASDSRRHANNLKGHERSKGYRVEVLDVDGNTTSVSFGSPYLVAF